MTNTESIPCGKTNNQWIVKSGGLESHPFLGWNWGESIFAFVANVVFLAFWSPKPKVFPKHQDESPDVVIDEVAVYWTSPSPPVTGQDEEALTCEVLASNALFRTSCFGWAGAFVPPRNTSCFLAKSVDCGRCLTKKIGQDWPILQEQLSTLEEDQQASTSFAMWRRYNVSNSFKFSTLSILDCFFSWWYRYPWIMGITVVVLNSLPKYPSQSVDTFQPHWCRFQTCYVLDISGNERQVKPTIESNYICHIYSSTEVYIYTI